MDASETVSRKRRRAPAGGVAKSAIPTQWLGKKYRAGVLHLAFVADKEVVTGRAQKRHSEMGGEIDAQSRKGRGASFVLDVGGPALSARVASFGQDLTKEKDRAHADHVMKAQERKLDARKQFRAQGRGRHSPGANPGRGARREHRKGALGGEGVPGPGSPRRQCGYRGSRGPKVVTFAIDFPGRPGGMEDPERGNKKRLSPSGWVWP